MNVYDNSGAPEGLATMSTCVLHERMNSDLSWPAKLKLGMCPAKPAEIQRVETCGLQLISFVSASLWRSFAIAVSGWQGDSLHLYVSCERLQ